MTPKVRVLTEHGEVQVLASDSITRFDDSAQGGVLICGSHGGRLAGVFAAELHPRGAVFNDAGFGKENAGVLGLEVLQGHGIGALAVSHDTARIGDGSDTYESGLSSAVNRLAQQAGVTVGMKTRDAVERMSTIPQPTLPVVKQANTDAEPFSLSDEHSVIGFDSVSMIGPEHAGTVAITGSHGGLVGGQAIRARVALAAFNDAGIGKDDAGISRLPVLDEMRIPAFTVSNDSARIGEAEETYRNGLVSALNQIAAELGVRVGMSARSAVAEFLAQTVPSRRQRT